MAEIARKIEVEIQNGDSNLTSFGGLSSIIKLFQKMKLGEIIDSCIGARKDRGAKDSEHVLALVLLNLAGGKSVDALSFLRKKLGLEKFGIRIPSPTACRDWLNLFHNPSEDSERGMGRCFIPESNAFLNAWRNILAKLFLYAWKLNPRKFLTFDMDDTEIQAEVGYSVPNRSTCLMRWSHRSDEREPPFRRGSRCRKLPVRMKGRVAEAA